MPRKSRRTIDHGPYGVPYGPNNPPSDEVIDKQRAAWHYRNLLESHVITRFKWNGLPETVSERYLERILMREGQALAFISKTGVEMALKVVSKGPFNVYREYIEFEAIGENGWQENVPTDKGVWIWDNELEVSFYPSIIWFANKLANLDIQQTANRDQQRQIAVFTGTKDQQLDLAHLARAMRMNEKSVVVDKKLVEGEPVRVLQTGVKYLQEEFNADKRSLMNEFFDSFGIEHIAMEKNAHMLNAEAKITADSVARIRENCLIPRKRAAEKMSELFNTEITVEWRKDEYSDIVSETNSDALETPEGGDSDG